MHAFFFTHTRLLFIFNSDEFIENFISLDFSKNFFLLQNFNWTSLGCAEIKMTQETICAKRIKLDPESRTNSNVSSDVQSKSHTITAILSEEHSNPIEQCSVYIAYIKDIKSISKIMSELCQLMPLNELNHLKRVNKSKLILCSLHDMENFLRQHRPEFTSDLPAELKKCDLLNLSDDMTTSLLKFYMSISKVSENIIELLSEQIEIVAVAASPPILSWQYADAIRHWPCKFHPNKDLEKLYAGTWFTNEQNAFHNRMIEICGFLRTELNKSAAGIAVDPRTKSIVAIGFDEIDQHPLMHCAMVLIDSVARSQNGGAWNDILVGNDENALYTHSSKSESTEYTQWGVSPFVRELISSKFPSIAFGAERVKSAAENRQSDLEVCSDGDNLAKYGPYLCTGYDIYLWREPCIMCSMALTHSRIRTIFFHEKHPNGAICSLTKLQSVKALNHHFQVFHIDG